MAEKPKKPQKLRARLPRGLEDRGPAAIAATRQMVEKIREVYERYGFEPVETPAMEYTDALGKFLPDQDRPNEGVFSFQDDDEQWISLRYDLTAPLARYVAENFDSPAKALSQLSRRLRLSQRKARPRPLPPVHAVRCRHGGRGSPAADAEMCMMAADTMEALGIPRGSYVVKVNNRKVLDGVLEAIGLGGEENAGRRLTVLRAIDKLDKFPADEVRKLLGPGRWDGGEEGKGDFTKGAGLGSMMPTSFWPSRKRATTGKRRLPPRTPISPRAQVGQAGVSELEEIAKLVTASGYGIGSHQHRSLRRPRPRILHRPRLRGRTHARNQGRKRPPGALRLGRRRRAL